MGDEGKSLSPEDISICRGIRFFEVSQFNRDDFISRHRQEPFNLEPFE
jgi:hypothetical protein